MSTRLYHRDVFLPPELVAPLAGRQFRLTYTQHAQSEVLRDWHLGAVARRGGLSLPFVITIDPATIFEAETVGGSLSKIVIRLPFDETEDIIFSLSPGYHCDWNHSDSVFVRTLWTNSKRDGHRTLKLSQYEQKPLQ